MSEPIIFYSWQSDRPNGTNQGLIQEALEKAIKSITLDDSTPAKPFLDRDTQGMPGSPHIVETILNKIDSADVFVADVTIITENGANRPAPNPNVLLELGYAIKALGMSRIIMIMNTSYGDVPLLPFDLGHLRVTKYALHESELGQLPTGTKKALSTPKSRARQHLSETFETALRLILDARAEQKEAATPQNTLVASEYEPTVKADASISRINRLRTALEESAGYLRVEGIMSEALDIALGEINRIEWFEKKSPLQPAELGDLMVKIDHAMTELLELAAFGTAHGEEKYARVWADILTRLADETASERFVDHVRLYPSLIYLYAGGIAATHQENYENLGSMFNRAKIRERLHYRMPESVVYNLVPARVIDPRQAEQLPGIGNAATPLNRHLYMMLSPKIKKAVPHKQDFTTAFVRFEYLFALADARIEGGIPAGSYYWEDYLISCRSRGKPYITTATDREIAALEGSGAEWKPYKAGVFGEIDWREFLLFKHETDVKLIKQLNWFYPDLKIESFETLT